MKKNILTAIMTLNLISAVIVLTAVLSAPVHAMASSTTKGQTAPVWPTQTATNGNLEYELVEIVRSDNVDYYPTILTVIAAQNAPEENESCVEFKSCDGFMYHTDVADGSVSEGECYQTIMYSNETTDPADDMIMTLRYQRIDLLPENESNRHNDTYSVLLKVTNIIPDRNAGVYCVTLVDSMGFEYYYESKDGDMCVNDYYTAIMDNEGTKYIYDDAIVSIRYERVDLFE